MFGISKYSAVKCLNYVGEIRSELFSKELELLINRYEEAYNVSFNKLELIRDKIAIAYNFDVKALMDELIEEWDDYLYQQLNQEIEIIESNLCRCNEFVDYVRDNWTDKIGGDYSNFKKSQIENLLQSASLYAVPERHINAKFYESYAYKKYKNNLPKLDKIKSLYEQVSNSMARF